MCSNCTQVDHTNTNTETHAYAQNVYTQPRTIIVPVQAHKYTHTQQFAIPVCTNMIPIIETINGVEISACPWRLP